MPLSVAAAGAAMSELVVSTKGCAGVSGSATGTSAVSRTTKRPTSIRREPVDRRLVDRVDVRGARVGDLAGGLLDRRSNPATYSSGRWEPRSSASIVGPSIGTYGSGSTCVVARRTAARTRRSPGPSAGWVAACGLPGREHLGTDAERQRERTRPRQQRRDAIEATARAHGRDRRPGRPRRRAARRERSGAARSTTPAAAPPRCRSGRPRPSR